MLCFMYRWATEHSQIARVVLWIMCEFISAIGFEAFNNDWKLPPFLVLCLIEPHSIFASTNYFLLLSAVRFGHELVTV